MYQALFIDKLWFYTAEVEQIFHQAGTWNPDSFTDAFFSTCCKHPNIARLQRGNMDCKPCERESDIGKHRKLQVNQLLLGSIVWKSEQKGHSFRLPFHFLFWRLHGNTHTTLTYAFPCPPLLTLSRSAWPCRHDWSHFCRLTFLSHTHTNIDQPPRSP